MPSNVSSNVMSCTKDNGSRILPAKRRNTMEGNDQPINKKVCSPLEQSNNEMAIGTLIGQYRVCLNLATGSYSRIYLGTRNTGKFAIKVQKHLSDKQKKDNIRESLVLSKINESCIAENLVKCFETIKHDQNICFIMEKLDFSLQEFFFMNRHKPLEIGQVAHLTHQLTNGASKLMEIGFLHLDIKPANILFCDRSDKSDPWKIKLCDFGFSVASNMISDYRGPVHTVNYRAPEVILGLPLCERVDSWSIGCVLFKVYTGLDLFTARDDVEMLRQITIVTGLPEDFQEGRCTNSFFEKTENDILVLRNSPNTKVYPMKYKTKGFDDLEKMGHTYMTTGSFTEMDEAIVRLINSLLQPSAKKRLNAGQAHDYMRLNIAALEDEEYSDEE